MLRQNIDDYLAVRRAAGYDLGIHEKILHSFERYASEHGDTHVRRKTSIEWAALAPSPGQRERRLKMVARFARHAKAEDPCHEIPPKHVFFKKPSQRYIAFIFSAEDIRRIIEAATCPSPKDLFLSHAFSTLFGLLAATGMRISEALALSFRDVTSDGLVIRQTKFRKSRLLPLHETTAKALARYLKRRQQVDGADDHLFVSSQGKPFSYGLIRRTFREIVRQLGLHPGPNQPQPRLHDFRHTFAVRALESCPAGCRDQISRHMLALSTYLGHSRVSCTYWYLQLTPHLVQDIANACETYLEEEQP